MKVIYKMNRNLTVIVNMKKKNCQKRISSAIKFNSVKLNNIKFFSVHSGKFSSSKNLKETLRFFHTVNFSDNEVTQILYMILKVISYLNWYMIPVATNQLCFLKMQCSSLVSGSIMSRLVGMDIQ